MQPKTDFFWEDFEQSMERLSGTVVLFNNEPILIVRIDRNPDSLTGAPIATILKLPNTTHTHRVSLSDPGFGLFRHLPRLGWANYYEGSIITCLHCSRVPIRSRLHGLNRQNVRTQSFHNDQLHRSENFSFDHCYSNQYFIDSLKGIFPTSKDILEKMDPGSALAFDHNGAIYRDISGIRWLYLNETKVGFFSSPTTLELPQSMSFYKEQVYEQPNLIVENVKEFW